MDAKKLKVVIGINETQNPETNYLTRRDKRLYKKNNYNFLMLGKNFVRPT